MRGLLSQRIRFKLRVLGYGLDLEALERVAIPAIEYAKNESEVLVIDEIGKCS